MDDLREPDPGVTSGAALRLAFCIFLAAVIGLTGLPAAAGADAVSALAAQHHHGQTFLTWTTPAGSGWTYRIYGSSQPILSGADLPAAQLLGAVGDSSWFDRRLSNVWRQVYGFCTDSLAPPLGPAQGLFVATAAAAGPRYYAVTAQAAGDVEDTALAAGQNALADSVDERVEPPQPVYQRTLYEGYGPVEVYTLWTWNADLPGFPAMANRPSVPFDCGLIRAGGLPGGGLMVCPHWWLADFMQSLGGSGQPGEWRLSVDDWLPNVDGSTFYYGYQQDYDILSDTNQVPTSGVVNDYTMRRVIYTIEWARAALPVDPHRVYIMGISMGGTCGMFLGLLRPDLVAGVWAMIPKVDLAADASTSPWQLQQDRQWGVPEVDLECSERMPVYDRLRVAHLAELDAARGTPPVFTFSGKNDPVARWGEKIPYYQAMNDLRLGGCFFFDQRVHSTTGPNYWWPMQSARYLYRFRTDLSFPALSNCSANSDPGPGDPGVGDTVGAINAFVEWDTVLVDSADRWEVTLWLRDLSSNSGPVPAPESLTVDVTPRRLQAFPVVRNQVYGFSETSVADSVVRRTGALTPDSLGLLTVRGVRVYRSGTRLRLWATGAAGTGPPPGRAAPRRLALAAAPNPARGTVRFHVQWPAAGAGRVDLLSVAGRVRRALWRGRVAAPGPMLVDSDVRGLAGGVYWAVARLGAARAATRVVVVP